MTEPNDHDDHCGNDCTGRREFATPEQVPADLEELTAPTGVIWWRDDQDPNLWYSKHDESLTRPLSLLFADYGHLAEVVHERHDPPGPVPGPLPGIWKTRERWPDVHFEPFGEVTF